jgi:hypothetical protein
MPKPFEALGEKLLRAGIAPRHVRAYLTELREHLADLVEQEQAAGGDALARAHARLGDDETLAQAMLSRRDKRSLTARAPWLVLGVAPPLLMILLMALTLVFLIALPANNGLMPGSMLDRLGQPIVIAANLLIPPGIVALFAWIAWRQRLAPAWALAACAIALLFFLHLEFLFARPDFHNLPPGLRLSYRVERHLYFTFHLVPIFHPRTWSMMAALWPMAMAQYVLTLLPVAFLWQAHKRKAA